MLLPWINILFYLDFIKLLISNLQGFPFKNTRCSIFSTKVIKLPIFLFKPLSNIWKRLGSAFAPLLNLINNIRVFRVLSLKLISCGWFWMEVNLFINYSVIAKVLLFRRAEVAGLIISKYKTSCFKLPGLLYPLLLGNVVSYWKWRVWFPFFVDCKQIVLVCGLKITLYWGSKWLIWHWFP